MQQNVLIFDADGVLIEPWGFANTLDSQFGITRLQTREFFRDPFQSCLLGRASLTQVLPDYLDQWGWSSSPDAFVQLWLESENLPNLELLTLVEQLRETGNLCCVASNQEPVRARYIAQQMGFAERFDALFFSCDLGAIKPQLEFYRSIEQLLGVASDQVHFWDDSPQHVEGAGRAGWNAYLYENLLSVECVR